MSITNTNPLQRNPQRVARSFSMAAQRYDTVAGLQRQVADQLLAMDFCSRHGAVLELGCGTGYVTWQLAQESAIERIWALDIAPGMVNYARHRRAHDKIHWLVADAHHLPYVTGSMEVVCSSLTLQWCEDLPRICAEVARVLKAEGCLQFATLGVDTLWELRQAWSMVDDHQHINDFLPLDRLQTALQPHFGRLRWVNDRIVLHYAQLTELTRQLKLLGAGNHNRAAAPGLMGRTRLLRLQQAYESLRDRQGRLPATYDVFYLQASEPRNRVGPVRSSLAYLG